MSFGPSFQTTSNTASRLLQQSLVFGANKATTRQVIINKTTEQNNNGKYSYRTCPICSQRLLVRINGSFVYKWISTHFSTHHHEWMHVVVNLHEA
jgi:hypothetical protein